MIVICQNDYPYEVLKEGSTDEQAQRRCRELREAAMKPQWVGHEPRQVYFHWHDVPVTEVS